MPSSTVPFPRRLAGDRWYSASCWVMPRTVCGSGCCGSDVEPGCVHRAPHLHHDVLVEAGERAAGVRQVHRQPVTGVVVVGMHHVEGQLELVDAAARPLRVEIGRVSVGLLGVVHPVVGSAAMMSSDRVVGGALQFAEDLRAVK